MEIPLIDVLPLTFYWQRYGCTILQSYDVSMDDALYHPVMLRSVALRKIWNTAYVQKCRSNGFKRLQFQVMFNDCSDVLLLEERILNSLECLGIDKNLIDIDYRGVRFDIDILGAKGSEFHYRYNGCVLVTLRFFDVLAGVQCFERTVGITYRLDALTHKVFSYDTGIHATVLKDFDVYEEQFKSLSESKVPLVIPAYDYYLKCVCLFKTFSTLNMLSAAELLKYTERLRFMADTCFKVYTVKARVKEYITLKIKKFLRVVKNLFKKIKLRHVL